jgi:hypothetical protein
MRFCRLSQITAKTVNSHYNIKKWGHSIEDVLYQYSSCLSIYEELMEEGCLFLINVDDPSSFSPQSFCRFLNGSSCFKFEEAVKDWKPVNDLLYQKDKFGEKLLGSPEDHPQCKSLSSLHFWIAEAESRYLKLVEDPKIH